MKKKVGPSGDILGRENIKKDILGDIRNQGIENGCLVEVILKEGAIPCLWTPSLVSYFGPEKDNENPSTAKYSGYIMMEECQKRIVLLPGWDDHRHRKIPEDANIGGVCIYLEAIYSCVKK